MCFVILALGDAEAVASVALVRRGIGGARSRNWSRARRSDGRVAKTSGTSDEPRVQPRFCSGACAAQPKQKRRCVAGRCLSFAFSGENVFSGNRRFGVAPSETTTIAGTSLCRNLSRAAAWRGVSRDRDSGWMAATHRAHPQHVCAGSGCIGTRAARGRGIFERVHRFSTRRVSFTSLACAERRPLMISDALTQPRLALSMK